jgi:hypothetical protein
VDWIAPATTPAPLVDYRIRCRTGEGEWVESDEGTSLDTSAFVEGLTNGAAYECEVVAVAATSEGAWTSAPATATPVGRPPPPAKPAVQALDRAVRIQVPAVDASIVSDYRYECSADQGQTWPFGIDVAASGVTSADVGNLTNGVEYVCRAFAANPAGVSEPSEASDAVRPCGSVIDCNPIVAPVLGVVGAVLFGGLLALLVSLYRDRTRGYVVAVVDVVHTANLGYGSRLGIRFVRSQPRGTVTGIVSDRSRSADLRIRHRGGDQFEVTDRTRSYVTTSGEPVIIVDPLGIRHHVILQRFRGSTASALSDLR